MNEKVRKKAENTRKRRKKRGKRERERRERNVDSGRACERRNLGAAQGLLL